MAIKPNHLVPLEWTNRNLCHRGSAEHFDGDIQCQRVSFYIMGGLPIGMASRIRVFAQSKSTVWIPAMHTAIAVS
jgi:hypothetical protein